MWVRRRIGVELAVCALGSLTLSGCAERPEREGTKAETHALSAPPVVSGPFDVERYPRDWDERAPGEFELGCGVMRCLAVHKSSSTGGHLVATRISIAGSLMDEPRIVLGEDEEVVGVAGCDDEFLVASTSGGTLRYRRIRGSDGRILSDDPTSRLPAEPPLQMVSTGASILILTRSGDDVAAQVFDANLEPAGDPAVLPAFSYLSSGAVPGDGQYLVASYGEAARIDEASGALLDSPPILFSRYNSGPYNRARGVYKDGVYQLAWAGGAIFGARIDAATGTPLDPDDTFNEVSGVKLLRTVNANLTSYFDVDLISDNVVVTYGYTNRDLEAIRVDVATGLAVDATAADLGLLAPAIGDGYPTFSVHGLGERAFLVNDATYLRTGIGYDDNRVVRFADDRSVAKTSYPRYSPRIASNGSTYLAVFERASTAYPSNPREIVATRVDPATGVYLDDPPLSLGVGEDVGVASDGTDYLVFYLEWREGVLHYHTRKVLADGTLRPEHLGRLEDSGSFLDTELTWNGTYYGAHFRAMTARFDTDGELVLPDDFVSGDRIGRLLGSGFSDDRAALAADTTPPPDMRTFLYVGSGSSVVSDVTAVRVRSLTGAMLGSTTVAPGHWSPVAASDGTRALVVSQPRNTSEWSGRFVDFVTGLPIEGTEKSLPDLTGKSVRRAFFDGTNFGITAMLGGDPLSVRLFRYTPELERVPGDPAEGTLLTHFDGNLHDQGIGFAQPGRGALAYGAYDLERLGFAVKLTFFNTDGSEPPQPPDPGTGGSGGADSGSAGAGSGDAGEPGGDAGGMTNGDAGSDGSDAGGTSSTTGGRSTGGSASTTGGTSSDGGADARGGTDGAGRPGSGEGGAAGEPGGNGGKNSRSGGGDDAGCGCRAGAPAHTRGAWLAFLMLAALASFRRGR